MSSTYIPPTLSSKKFTCPHCAAISHQQWFDVSQHLDPIVAEHKVGRRLQPNTILTAVCYHCKEYSLWHADKMVYPSIGG